MTNRLDFNDVLRLREFALQLSRKDDRAELDSIADRLHAMLVQVSIHDTQEDSDEVEG